MRLTHQARLYLTAFWQDYPYKRKNCIKKYGYDPIIHETQYWIHGISEEEHSDVLAKIRANNNVFSLQLARKWANEELKS
jgi:hypothetical protein